MIMMALLQVLKPCSLSDKTMTIQAGLADESLAIGYNGDHDIVSIAMCAMSFQFQHARLTFFRLDEIFKNSLLCWKSITMQDK